MPLPAGTRFRVKKTSKGKIRLAFGKGTNKVIETKKLDGEHEAHKIMGNVRSRRGKR